MAAGLDLTIDDDDEHARADGVSCAELVAHGRSERFADGQPAAHGNAGAQRRADNVNNDD